MNTQKNNSSDRRLIYLGLAALVLIIGGVIFGLSGSLVPQTSNAALVLEKTNHSFGKIDIFGGKVSTEYPIKNTSDEPIDILWGKTTCMCTEGEIDGKTFGMHGGFTGSIPVDPGETKMLKATFDPMAHGPDAVGPIKRSLILGTNSEATKEIEVKFDGNVVKNQ